ncbi:hypothetical protein Cflav_PD1427 [Pedosphaera parvula Ellin514]|uniref:Type II secretion system protein GspG C-terminal domain-containing protein n=2 Tax=Pedosphaera TaxID=1032526 RepID=B9XPJ9_PEDPL|nr:hypothetical protein Cflav_PD1427 [Pedosphaera parvula Ellin514]
MWHWSLAQWGMAVLAGLIVLVALFYCEEDWRGKQAWDNYKSEMRAQGKALDWATFIPSPVPVDENVFGAPNMSPWFVKSGGTIGVPMGMTAGLSGLYQGGGSNAMAEITIVPPNAVVAAGEADLVLSYNPPVLAMAETNVASVAGSSNSIIPLIVMNEVRLSDAITNIAHAAGVKYLLDSKVVYERNADGSLFLDAPVSLRWTNVTGHQALQELLKNYNLRLVEDSKTGVARITKKDLAPSAEPEVRERLKKVFQDWVEADTNAPSGPSLVAPQGYTIYSRAVQGPKPVRIVVKAEEVPRSDEIAGFFPGNQRMYGSRFLSRPQAKLIGSNVFRVSLNPPTHVGAADYLAWSDQFEPEFATMREGLKRPYAQMVGSYEIPNAMPIPNFVAVRVVPQTLAQRAQCYLLLGQPEKALEELTMMNDLCRMLEGRPMNKAMTLAAAMINVAVRGIYVGVVADGLRLQAWQEPQLAVLQQQLGEIDLLPYLAAGFETARVASCYTLEHTSPEQYDKVYRPFPSSSTTFRDKLKDPMFVFLSFAPRGWVYQNMVNMGRMNLSMLDGLDLTNHLVLPRAAESSFRKIESSMGKRWPETILAAQVIPNFKIGIQVLARNQTLVNEALVVCALERYHFVHGQYPENLESLVPKFMEKLPHDIVGGQPLKYRAEKGQFKLYSIGWNEKDDGGVAGSKKDGAVDLEADDWVWPYREKLGL